MICLSYLDIAGTPSHLRFSPTSSLHPRAENANPGWRLWRTNDVDQKQRTRQGYDQRGLLCHFASVQICLKAAQS